MEGKKIWAVLLIIVGALVITLVLLNLNRGENNQDVQNGSPNAGDITAENITATKQGDVDVTDVTIMSTNSITNVSAQVTNNSSKTYSVVEISVIFYDDNNAVLATAKGLIENLAPETTKGFSSSITGDFSQSSKYEVKVDELQ